MQNDLGIEKRPKITTIRILRQELEGGIDLSEGSSRVGQGKGKCGLRLEKRLEAEVEVGREELMGNP